MSLDRISRKAGWCWPKDLPKGPNGRNICRCGCGREVPPARRTFYSAECVDGWRITTDPNYIRQKVFKRDGGVCRRCGVNAHILRLRLRRLVKSELPTIEGIMKLYGIRRTRWGWFDLSKSLWEAHHIVPVADGGGECGLDNYETVCIWCHREETKTWRKNKSQMSKPFQQ